MKLMNAAIAKISACVMLVTSSLLGATSAGLAQKHGDIVNLRAESTRGQCLTFSRDRKASMRECGSAPFQNIKFSKFDVGLWWLQVDGFCIVSRGGSESVTLDSCSSRPNRAWTVNRHGQIKNNRGECLHVWLRDGPTNPKVTTNNCTGQPNQKWAHYQPVGREGAPDTSRNAMITPKHAPGKCLDLTRENKLVIWDCHGRGNQQLSFEWGRTTQIRIDGKCLAMRPGAGRFSAVHARDCRRDDPTQIWSVSREGEIKNSQGRCLDVKEASLRNGTDVIGFRCNGQNNQRFYPRR